MSEVPTPRTADADTTPRTADADTTPRTAARVEEGLLEAQRLLPPAGARPRLRWWALCDPANLLILGVTVAAGVGRGEWLLALAALAAEAVWLLIAPWLPGVRGRLEERDRRDRAEREKARRALVLGDVSAGDRARVEALLELRAALAARAVAGDGERGDLLLAALAKVDALLGLCALEARRAAELRAYLEGMDPEQIERDRHRLERETPGYTAAESGLESVRQREARVRAARAGLEDCRARVAALEGAVREAASVPAADGPVPSLAALLDGVDALAMATAPAAAADSWSRLMQRTP